MKLAWQIVKFQLKETFAIAYGNYTFRKALILCLERNGKKGYGECTAIDYYNIELESYQSTLEQLQYAIEKQKINHPFEFYVFLESLQLPSFLRSALDCAYWDLFGKLERLSFLEINSIDISQVPESSITISVDTVENQIHKIKESAWNKFKVKCNTFHKESVQQLLQLDTSIALDSNGSFTPEDCRYLEETMDVSTFSYLEQPMQKGEEHYMLLHAGKYANWMADEDCQDSSVLKDLVPHYKSINIKLVKCGGLTPALQMIFEARELGFSIMIGCMTESSIGISAGAVLTPLCDYADLDGANLISNDIAKGSQIINGTIHLNQNHGLGIQML